MLSIHHFILLDIYVKFCQKQHMNPWVMGKNLFYEVIVTLTFDHQILISSSLIPNGILCLVWKKIIPSNSLSEICIHRNGMDRGYILYIWMDRQPDIIICLQPLRSRVQRHIKRQRTKRNSQTLRMALCGYLTSLLGRETGSVGCGVCY